jgi:omega-amidase
MQEILKITLVQFDIAWENRTENLNRLEGLLPGKGETDVVILPEMFTTGFSMHPERVYETMEGKTIRWLKTKAREKDVAITGSVIIKEQDKMYNRCLWVSPDGGIKTYDKHHLFTMGEENKHYTAGASKLIAVYKGWRICPLICYDLRFPVWSRNRKNYDILIYMANWPSPRHYAWKKLLTARAIENQAFCFGVNRTGSDEEGASYLGDSAFIDAKGYGVFLGSRECIRTFEVSWSELHDLRHKFPFLPDMDRFIFRNN